jgi:plastocyanin
MIAVLLLAGSLRVAANDQASAANAAVNIDNFVFGPQTLTVPVGARRAGRICRGLRLGP